MFSHENMFSSEESGIRHFFLITCVGKINYFHNYFFEMIRTLYLGMCRLKENSP